MVYFCATIVTSPFLKSFSFTRPQDGFLKTSPNSYQNLKPPALWHKNFIFLPHLVTSCQQSFPAPLSWRYTEPLQQSFKCTNFNTSFQYPSIPCNAFIAYWNFVSNIFNRHKPSFFIYLHLVLVEDTKMALVICLITTGPKPSPKPCLKVTVGI